MFEDVPSETPERALNTQRGCRFKPSAAMFPAESSRLLLREEATESRLRRQAIAQYRILSFATHGLIKGDIESLAEAALVLTPESDRDTQRDGLWVIAPRRRAVA